MLIERRRQRGAGRRLALACIALVVVLPVRTSAHVSSETKPAPIPLEVGKAVERTVTEETTLTFSIALSAGEYARVTAEDTGRSTGCVLHDPQGREVFSTRTPSAGSLTRSDLEIVVDESGVYALSLTVTPRAKTVPFSIVLDARHPATDVDRKRAAAYRLTAESVAIVRDDAQSPDAKLRALESLVDARGRWQALGDSRRDAAAASELAAAYALLGRSRDVVGMLPDVVAYVRPKDEDGVLLSMLYSTADAHLDLGEPDAAEATAKDMEDIIRKRGGDDYWEYKTLMLHFGLCLDRNDGQCARAYAERGDEVGARAGLGPHPAARQIAFVDVDEGRFAEALAIYKTLIPETERRKDYGGVIRALAKLSTVLLFVGDYQETIAVSERGLALSREHGVTLMESAFHSRLGYAYTEFGELGEAEREFDVALRIARANGYSTMAIDAMFGLSRLHLLRGEGREALAGYEAIVAELRARGLNNESPSALMGVGASYAMLGDAARSDAAFEHALELTAAKGRIYEQEMPRLEYGIALAKRGAAKAEPVLERALEIARSIRHRSGVALALYQLARIDRDAGNLDRAKARIREAIELVETLRSGLKSPERRTSYFATVRSYYDLYADVLMRAGGTASAAEAFTVAERGRGRVLLETLSERGVDLTGGVDPKLKAEQQAAFQQLAGRLDYQVRLLGREHTPEEAELVAREIADLESRLADAEGQLRLASPAYAALTSPEPVTAERLQRGLLDSETALVAYNLGEDAGYVWAVTTEGVTSARIAGQRAIEAHVQALRKAAAARACAPKNEASDERAARVKAADAAYRVEARELGDEILAPVAGALKGKRLAVVPDGALALVPFGALVEPGTDRYVIEGHEVVTLPSATALRTLREQEAKRTTPAGAVAIVADPVFDARDERVTNAKTSDAPKLADSALALRAAGAVVDDACGERAGLERLRGSAREAEAIAALAPKGRTLEALGFAANLDLATSGELGKYRIVHFATHGYVPAETPELSGLVLSLVDETGKERPGYLGMPQIYAMRLPVETVVLSACETGLGREVSGEGVIGLVRGFMYAGSSRVVSSLWKIDDAETAGLMAELYAGMLKRGRTPSAALREAQLKLIEEGKSPYVWGAFQLAGEWR